MESFSIGLDRWRKGVRVYNNK